METFKTNEGIFVFGFTYIISFTLLYTFLFYDISAFIIFLLMILLFNILSLISVLGVSTIIRVKKKKFNFLGYILISIFLFIVSIYYYKIDNSDPRNIFPIFKEPLWLFILLSISTHFIAYLVFKIFTYIKYKNA